MTPPVPDKEPGRLDALRRSRSPDTPPEAVFDDLTRLAAQLCGVPMAAISLIDADRQWFKSAFGLPLGEAPRAVSFCAYVTYSPIL